MSVGSLPRSPRRAVPICSFCYVEALTRAGCLDEARLAFEKMLTYANHAGQESPSLTFVARTHARHPLFTTAAGKALLAGVPDEDMYRPWSWQVRNRQETSGSSSPSSPRSAPADSPSTAVSHSRTLLPWPRPCWHPTAVR